MPRIETEPHALSAWRDAGRSLIALFSELGRVVRGESHEEPELEHPEIRFEMTDLRTRPVVITGFSILGVMWLSAFALFFYYRFAAEHIPQNAVQAAPVAPAQNAQPPEPRLQVSPRTDYQAFAAYENAQLSKYSWIDRANGVVGIPIERAMELIAQRGIPPQPASEPLPIPQAGTRDTGFRGKIQPEP